MKTAYLPRPGSQKKSSGNGHPEPKAAALLDLPPVNKPAGYPHPGAPKSNAASHAAKSPPSATVTFRFTAPAAHQVRLAGDFTDWEKLPLDLRQGADGIWEIQVPLAPGRYGYRFLVDGQWQDDPHCGLRESNPFGTTNAVLEVGTASVPSNGCL